MSIFDHIRHLKIKYKIFFILIILFALIGNLAILNIVSIKEIQSETFRLSNELTPRLLATSDIKDHVHLSVLSAYDYVHTGNTDRKAEYEKEIQKAVQAQIKLFYLSQTNADFQFTTSFQDNLNALTTALEDLIQLYESDADDEAIQNQLTIVLRNQAAFTQFMEEKIELNLQTQSQNERNASINRVQRTTNMVMMITGIALLSLMFIYVFTHKSITAPIEELTSIAQDISHGHFRPANIDNYDELGIFADTFNTMIQKLLATQEALKIELEKTKQLDKQKSEFLAIAAHQLRTPMSGIKWMLAMAVDGDFGKTPPDLKVQLHNGLDNTNRMITLINNLLDVTQMETEKITAQLIPTDIIQLVTDVYEELQPIAKKAKVALQTIPPSRPFPRINIDPEKIKMAIHNIVDNAIKYTPAKGTVTIEYELNTDTLAVHVQDTGYGIPPEEQDRVFSKLYRGSNIQNIQVEGSGLGLFIASEIMKQHGGDILFESELKKGTRFTLIFPLA